LSSQTLSTAALPLKNRFGSLKDVLLNNVVWVLLLLAIVVVGCIQPVFFSHRILRNVLTQATVLGVLSYAQAQAIMLGVIDLSLIGTMTFAATIGTLSLRAGTPVFLAVLLILAVGLGIGFINGLLIAKLKAVALIETLSVKLILLGAFMAITQGRAIVDMPDNYKWVGQGSIGGFPVLPVFLFLIFFLVHILWNKMPVGRSLFAVGGNPSAAYVSGIKIDRIRIFAFSFSGLLAGLAGFLLSGYMGAVTSTFGTSYDMNNIAAAVIGGISLSGGIGTAQGIFGGVLLLTVIQVGLQILGVSTFHVQMANGIIIFVAVIIDALRLKIQA
jgi:simple sugar transport system permease protein/ribose transport system permease protein